jgi:hypothetical protein
MPKESEMNMKTTFTVSVLVGFALTLSAGCACQPDAENKDYIHGENYLPDSTARDETKVIDVSVACGARADGELRAYHFSDDSLNSLGKKKLDYMVAADPNLTSTLTVYMDFSPKDPNFAKRHDAVTEYLKLKGLKDEQIALVDGPNETQAQPSAPGNKALDNFTSTGGSFTSGDSSTTAGAH